MEGYKSRIGKQQMEQYMGGLYESPMVVFREYIQNACDAVEDALSAGLIQERKKSTISVNISKYNRSICIEDRGIGIKSDEIGPRLVDVASSKKVDRAGQYGIGRLNGASYCDKIVYETSFAGEPVKSTLEWDVKKAREICNSDEEPTVEEIIDAVTHKLPDEPENEEAHYCKVTLVNVNNDDLLDEDKAMTYIAQIVPVDYSTEFKDELIKPSLEIDANKEYKDRFSNLWIYKISVNGIPVEKSYVSVTEDNKFKFRTLHCFKIYDSKNDEELAWGWFALNTSSTQMNEVPFSKIRARIHNYQIGRADYLSYLFPSDVSASYFIGELHLTHPGLQPSSTRDGIKAQGSKPLFDLLAKKIFKELYDVYNKASKFKSEVVQKIADAQVEIAKQQRKLKAEEDPEEKKKIRKKISEQKDNIETAKGKAATYSNFFQKNDLVEIADDVVAFVNDTVVKKYNATEAVIKADAQISKLKTQDYIVEPTPVTPQPTPAPDDPNTGVPKPNGNGGETTPPDGPVTPPEPPTPPAPPSEMDAYKDLSSVEKKLIRKVYSVLNEVDLPEKLREKIKTKLRKKVVKK